MSASASRTTGAPQPAAIVPAGPIPGDAVGRARRFEGSINHLYLDTVGAVTVGVGRMLPNATSATAIDFLRNTDQTRASDPQIRNEFAVIHGKPRGRVASFYKQFTTLHLTGATIDALLTDDLQRVVTGVAGRFPDYPSYPVAVQEALVEVPR